MLEILFDMFDVPSSPETVEPRVYNKRKRTTEFLNTEPKLKKYRQWRKSSQRGGVL